MLTNLYSIYDTISELFNKPFVEINDKSAIRAFTDSIEKNNNRNDYVLYHIGGFNDNSGDITPNSPLKIYSGIEIKSDNVTNIA